MANLGYETPGASIRQINNTARGSVHTALSSGTLTSGTARIEDGATGDTFVMCVYDATNLSAATLVATSTARTDISTVSNYVFTFAGEAIVSGTPYFIGVGSNSAAGASCYHDSGTGYSIGSFNPAAPPASTDLDATNDLRLCTTFITYTVAGGDVLMGQACL